MEKWGGNSLGRSKQLIEALADWDHRSGMMPPWMQEMRHNGRIKPNGNRMVPPLKMHLDLTGLPVDDPSVWPVTNPRLLWLSEQLVHLDDPRFDFSRHNAQCLKGQDPNASGKAYRFDLIEPDSLPSADSSSDLSEDSESNDPETEQGGVNRVCNWVGSLFTRQ